MVEESRKMRLKAHILEEDFSSAIGRGKLQFSELKLDAAGSAMKDAGADAIFRSTAITTGIAIVLGFAVWAFTGQYRDFVTFLVVCAVTMSLWAAKHLILSGNALVGVALVVAVSYTGLAKIVSMQAETLLSCAVAMLLIYWFAIIFLPVRWQVVFGITCVTSMTALTFIALIANREMREVLYTHSAPIGGALATAIGGVITIANMEKVRRVALGRANQSIATLEYEVATRTQALREEHDRAIQNARYLALLNQLSVGLVEQRDRGDLMNALADGVCKLLNVANSDIRTLTAAGDALIPSYARGKFSVLHLPTHRDTPGLVAMAWNTAQLQYCDDYLVWSMRLESPRNTWMRSVAVAPMIVDGRVIGTLGVAHDDDRLLSELDRDYLNRLAQFGSVLLQNLGALETARREIREREATEAILHRNSASLAALRDTTLDLMRNADIDSVFEAIISKAARLVDAAGGHVLMVNATGDALEQKVASGVQTERANAHRTRGEGLSGTVWQTGKAMKIDDYPAWANRSAEALSEPVVQSAMCVPMILKDQVVGVIGVVRLDKASGFSDEEMQILERFARLAAVAYLNATLYEDVQRQRDFAATILANMNQAVMVLDMEGRLEYTNPANGTMLGYELSELIGRPVSDLMEAADAATIAANTRRVQMKEPSVSEYSFLHKDGHPVRLKMSCVPRVKNGEVVGVIAVADDITAQLEMVRNLRAARDQALEASRLKTRFVATMSHEIRTPMNVILGLTELALNDPALTPELRDLLTTSFESSQSLHHLISDMLDFAKIEAGKFELNIEAIDLREQVAKIIAMFEARVQARGVALRLEIAPDVPGMVNADITRLRQVLSNLLGNAEKFTTQGDIMLRLSMLDGTRHARLLFEISDTGIGIAPAVQSTLFEPFRQGDSSTTRMYGGTGLGLAICKSLVQLMGGEIGVKSTSGKGSTFWFTLPESVPQ